MKNTGGPAFPIPGLQEHEEFNGMTLRDYFAARAPMPIPDWFKHEPSRPRPTTPSTLHLSATERDDACLLLEGRGEWLKATDRTVDFVANCKAAAADLDAWRDEQRRLKFFSWRYAYADAMLAERAKP